MAKEKFLSDWGVIMSGGLESPSCGKLEVDEEYRVHPILKTANEYFIQKDKELKETSEAYDLLEAEHRELAESYKHACQKNCRLEDANMKLHQGISDLYPPVFFVGLGVGAGVVIGLFLGTVVL